MRETCVLVILAAVACCGTAIAEDPFPIRRSHEDRTGIDSVERDNQAVREALNRRMNVEWRSVPLEAVARRLSAELGVNVLLDRRGLEEAGATPDQEISISLRDVRFRSALKLALEPLQLTADVHEGVLRITSQEIAGENVITRVYPVADLIDAPPPRVAEKPALTLPVPEGTKVIYRRSEPEPWWYGPDYDTLIDLIETSIAPDSWVDSGGMGSISGFRRTLVISQTDDVHDQIERLLLEIRRAEGSN
jgi:general secretion pathway protein D